MVSASASPTLQLGSDVHDAHWLPSPSSYNMHTGLLFAHKIFPEALMRKSSSHPAREAMGASPEMVETGG